MEEEKIDQDMINECLKILGISELEMEKFQTIINSGDMNRLKTELKNRGIDFDKYLNM
jgi:phosphotransferase system IIB component